MTTAKVPAAPFTTTVYSNPKALTATTTATASFDSTANTNFKIVNKFSLFVVGQSDANEEPTKSVSSWISTNATTRKGQSVDVSTNVSSFAIVVDVTTKKALETAVYCNTGAGAAQDQTNTTTAALVGCTAGQIGKAFGFWIANGTSATSVLHGFRVFRKVLTIGDNTPAVTKIPATFSTVIGTYAASVKSGLTIADYKVAPTVAASAVVALTWGTEYTCDIAKWDSASACRGFDAPWAYGAFTDYVGGGTPVNGSIKAWHFLAEKNADITKNFQIIKDDKINWILEEINEDWLTSGAFTNTITNAHTYGNFVATGATQVFVGATAVIAGVVASMF